MDLADRLAAAKRQRLGIPEPAPDRRTVAQKPTVDLTGPTPVVDLTESLLPPVTVAAEVAAVSEHEDEPVLDDGFAATDPNAVTSWSWDASGNAGSGDGWLAAGDAAPAADPSDADASEDDLGLPDNDTWARALRERRRPS
ncbi:MAG: hypothetical protein KDB33_13210 [Acidimicrobiales bacterium]|nr:hypothetical protein [Acidimicrobiales bacterium]MCB1261324.1 hypothetical protein [Acidimicrobiales bacterium]